MKMPLMFYYLCFFLVFVFLLIVPQDARERGRPLSKADASCIVNGMIRVERCDDKELWDASVLDTDGHPLQLWGWGDVKARGNWQVERVFIYENDDVIGQCQILLRPLPWPLRKLAYAPRGPVASHDKREAVLQALARYAKARHGAVALTVEPDWKEMPHVGGWKLSPNPILMAKTLILDLAKSEEELLSHMKANTRQNIRRSERAGVEVRSAKNLEDVAACLEVYKETAKRAGFALHKDEYYEDIFSILGSHSQLFMAVYEQKVVSFVWLAMSKKTAFELYGGMNEAGKRIRANYILKWEAIRRSKEWGVEQYDMNGLLNDGVSEFKRGFADHETMLAGTYEKPLSVWYSLWATGLPAAKRMIRLVRK